MSKINDNFIHNFYDLIEKVYVYNHMKTYLMDKQLQNEQYLYIISLVIVTCLINIIILLKVVLILIYFCVVHIVIHFFNFICSLFKTKFHINWKSKMANMCVYFSQIISRVYFYNFYKYNNMFISLFLICIYLIFIFSNCIFLILVWIYIEEENKNNSFILWHYLTFESTIIIEFSCSIIYSMRNLNYQFIFILFYIIFFNVILYITYLYQQLYINVEGYKATKNPIKIVNIIFNFIFLVLHLNAIINIKTQNRTSKNNFFYIFRNFI